MIEAMGRFPQNAVHMARYICEQRIREGFTVVDATMGNGNDTSFLAKLVTHTGKIYAFDIQYTAIESTMDRLSKQSSLPEMIYIRDGHENMERHIGAEEVDFVIFNLGYLPKGDHSITTRAETTIAGIDQSMRLIKKYGMVVVVVYHGHSEGKREKDAIEEYIGAIDQKKYNVVKFSFANQINNPPYVIAIEKI